MRIIAKIGIGLSMNETCSLYCSDVIGTFLWMGNAFLRLELFESMGDPGWI